METASPEDFTTDTGPAVQSDPIPLAASGDEPSEIDVPLEVETADADLEGLDDESELSEDGLIEPGDPIDEVPDDSVEEYFRELLARHRTVGDMSVEAIERMVDESTKSAPLEPSLEQLRAKAAEARAKAIPTPQMPPRRPKTVQAVSAEDLRNLREAANESAVSAIGTYDCKRLIQSAYANIAVGLLAIVVSFILIAAAVLWKPAYYPVAVATMLVGAVACIAYLYVLHRIWKKLPAMPMVPNPTATTEAPDRPNAGQDSPE